MVDTRVVLKSQAGLLVILGALLCMPGLQSVFHRSAYSLDFLLLALGCAVLGIILWYPVRHHEQEVTARTAFLVVSLSWLTACFVGALPYILTNTTHSFANAWFESVSGFTGTGSTVLSRLDTMDHGVLLWRSLTQWVGGLGIIVFFIAVLPVLGLSISQLFRAEAAGPDREKISPRVEETAKKLWSIYVCFTAILAIILWFLGMSPFDSVNHAFTALATGGFSTHDAGIKFFNSRAIEGALMLFMFLGSVNFALHYRLLIRRERAALFSTELKMYVGTLLAAIIIIAFCIWEKNYDSFGDALWYSAFTSICLASSTGFTLENYDFWGSAPQLILMALMMFGGMSGSTSGGMKHLRVAVALKHAAREMKQAIHPNALLTVKVDGHSLPPHVLSALWGAVVLYLVFFFVVTLILCLGGADIVTASSAALSALSGVGPAMGELNPYTNHALLPVESKYALSMAMLAGRLEFFAILIPLSRGFWRNH